MPNDIINRPVLHQAIEAALARLGAKLEPHRAGLMAFLTKALGEGDHIRPARRRKSDPGWAQAKRAEGATLYRFFPEAFPDYELEGLLRSLAPVAQLAADDASPLAREARGLLRGLTHRRDQIWDLRSDANDLVEKEERRKLLEHKNTTLREPCAVEHHGLVGQRCSTIAEIVALGREARNCLDMGETYWRAFRAGQLDIWSVRDAQTLVAVLAVDSLGRRTEAFGPRNRPVPISLARRVAAFCTAASLGIDDSELGVVAAFADQPIIDRHAVIIRDGIALYTEWESAVRVDFRGDRREAEVLVLNFDASLSPAEEQLTDADPMGRVRTFGRKRLRRIVGQVALGQTRPSLVQSRLLAMAS